MMLELNFLSFCVFLCGSLVACTKIANLQGVHHQVIKRQTDVSGPDQSQSSQHTRRLSIYPDGASEPFYRHQSPASSSREVRTTSRHATAHVKVGESSAGRPATAHLTVGGLSSESQARPYSNVGGSSPNPWLPLTDRGSRGRTYNYPFGRERVQYTETESQGSGNQGISASDSRSRSNEPDLQREAGQQQDRHNSNNGLSNQRSYPSYQNDLKHNPANQQSSFDPATYQEQEFRRRQEERRLRHETERRKQEEERRRLTDERRKQEEERRRQYYERLNKQKQSRERENNPDPRLSGSRDQQSGSMDNQRQLFTNRTFDQRRAEVPEPSREQPGSVDRRQERPYDKTNLQQRPSDFETTTQQQPGSFETRREPPHRAYNPQRAPSATVATTKQQPGLADTHREQSFDRRNPHQRTSAPEPTTQQQPGSVDIKQEQPIDRAYHNQTTSSSEHTSEQSAPKTAPNYQQEHQQFPTSQQSRDSRNFQQSGSSTQFQPTQNSQQGNPSAQHPIYPTNDSGRQGSQTVYNQRQSFLHGYNQQTPQTDPRLPGLRSNNDQAGRQSPRYGGNIGSTFTYEPQDNDLECPETGIDLRINGLDCQQAIQLHGTYLCYTHEFTSRECCNVCKQRKQPSRTGCEFGDHAGLCSSISATDCYDLRNRYSCCETCNRFKRSNLPTECEYGDMTSRCDNVRQNPGLCYIPDNQRLCCETCSQIRNFTNTGCPWGDYSSSLCQLFEENSSNVRINCYSQQRRRLCCQSCERLRQWLPSDLPADCQYGDRPALFTTSQYGRLNCSSLFTYFSSDECLNNEAVAQNCCHTCHRILNSRG